MQELRHYTAKITAGTTPAAPLAFDFTMPPRTVRGVEVIVPPGPSGLVGFALTQSGVTVIPYGSDPWVITDNEKIAWALQDYNDAGSWGLRGYNSGAQDHTIYVRFLVDIPGKASTDGTPGGLVSAVGVSDLGYDVGPAVAGGGGP